MVFKELAPDHNTINNFRKDNTVGIRKVFQATVSVAKKFDLIGGKLLAGDSSKFRAQKSKKNNYNKKKVERHQPILKKSLSNIMSCWRLRIMKKKETD
jgi:transposase